MTNSIHERQPVPLAQALREVMDAMEKADLKKRGTLFMHWPEIVGRALALHTKPYSVRGKRLTVSVDSSDWLYEINAVFEKKILENVQQRVGADIIEEIRYKVGEV